MPETRVALTVVRWPHQVVVGITADAWWRLRSTLRIVIKLTTSVGATQPADNHIEQPKPQSCSTRSP